MAITKGFCERAWQVEGREWKGQPLFKAIVDGHEVDFFIQSRILDYEGKEIEYDLTEGQYGKKGRLPKTDAEKKQFVPGGGYKGKSPSEQDSILKQVCLKASVEVAVAFIGVNKCPDIARAEQLIVDAYRAFYAELTKKEA